MVIKFKRKKQQPKSLHAVFFDLDETLIKNNIPVRKLFPRVFVDFKDAIAINNTKAISPTKAPGLAKAMVAHFFELGSKNVELHDGAIETLNGLREKGVTIGIVTNGIETLQMGKIKQLGLDKYIDNLTISGEARAHKPDKEIFDIALSRAKGQVENAWFVGDHVTNDIVGSVNAGMNSIYYNPTNLRVEESFAKVIERPNYTINHLTELLEYL